MQFHTPQFIEIEDKIFGPFTFKQFIYLIGGFGLGFILYKIGGLITPILGYILFIPPAGFGAALAFLKVNDRPFIVIVESAVKFFFSKNLYVWKKESHKAEVKREEKKEAPTTDPFVPRLSNSKLKELSWGLDVLDLNRPNNQE